MLIRILVGATNRPLTRQPALFMTVRREIAQSPCETGARSREAGQHPAWEFRRGCAPFVGILQGGWPPCKSGEAGSRAEAAREGGILETVC
jgi:hypothetical protein